MAKENKQILKHKTIEIELLDKSRGEKFLKVKNIY